MFRGSDSDLCSLQIQIRFQESRDGLLTFELFVGADLSTSLRCTASEEVFNNLVLVQGQVIPPSVLKLRSAGARVLQDSEVLHQGCHESLGPATNLARKTDLNVEQGFMTTKCQIISSVGQGPCKR